LNGEEQPLPIGSTLKGGTFYWQLGAGFSGGYPMIFERPDGQKVPVRVRVVPKSFAAKEPETSAALR